MSHQPTIECKPDGPYLVKNLDHLRDANGVPIEAKPVMALCRCGGSANKPFCDGTHNKNGFSGARLADPGADRLDDYAAARITIHDNRSICAHAGRCTDGLAAVFKYKSEPWIDPAGAAVDQIIEAIHACPSGALSYTLEGVAGADRQRTPSITVSKDGPYEVVGAPQLLGQPWAQGAAAERFTLCRCGASKNKPFCDGTHWSIGFKDEGRPPEPA
jgi:CDGSH-type Zn-finger protein